VGFSGTNDPDPGTGNQIDLTAVVRLTYRRRTVFVTMELRHLRYLVVVAFMTLSTAMAKAASAINISTSL
jgi:hypothetical protein